MSLNARAERDRPGKLRRRRKLESVWRQWGMEQAVRAERL
jgi:hypothetical protein